MADPNDDESPLDQKLEWERARQILEKGDEQILDLRKVGFSFVTALITASAYFGGKDTPATADPSYVGPLIAMAAMAALVALFFCDEEIASRQKATAARAGILERFSPVELTDFLRGRAQSERWDGFRRFVYTGFLIVAFLIGAAGPATTLVEGLGEGDGPPTAAHGTSDPGGGRDVEVPAANGTTLRVECSPPPVVSTKPVLDTALVAWLCLLAVAATGLAAALAVWRGKFHLGNQPRMPLRPGMTDWTLNRWVYDFQEPVFIQIANQGTADDYLPYLEDFGPKRKVVARLRPISNHAGRTKDIEWKAWSAPLTGSPRPGLPEVREPHDRSGGNPWSPDERLRIALGEAGGPRWLLRAQTTFCLPITIEPDEDIPDGWYEVIIASGQVLKRRLRVKRPLPPPTHHQLLSATVVTAKVEA
jgi:hypothetical protein